MIKITTKETIVKGKEKELWFDLLELFNILLNNGWEAKDIKKILDTVDKNIERVEE